MAKCILMSIKPKYVSMILNKTKTIEVRKRFPSDYVGWVYIYCTKDKKIFLRDFRDKKKWAAYWRFVAMENDPTNVGELPPILNGKVVARFWCNKVEEILARKNKKWYHLADTIPMCDGDIYHICQKSCLSQDELHNYLKSKRGKAIHITKLEIFDKPKEISEFHKPSWAEIRYKTMREEKAKQYRLSSAPQSWCYIEIGE